MPGLWDMPRLAPTSEQLFFLLIHKAILFLSEKFGLI
jgi:hypothetical protein